MQMVKNLNFLGLPKSNYSLIVYLRVFVKWFSPETALEAHLKLLQNSSSNRRGLLKSGNVELGFSILSVALIVSYFEKINVGLERYFQMKETASQSDKVDRRNTGLKLGVLNKN